MRIVRVESYGSDRNHEIKVRTILRDLLDEYTPENERELDGIIAAARGLYKYSCKSSSLDKRVYRYLDMVRDAIIEHGYNYDEVFEKVTFEF